MSRLFFCILLFLPVMQGFAQEDTYHAWLRTHLSDQYGISGGEWVLGESESETSGSRYISPNTQIVAFSPQGQPFSNGLKLNVPVRGENPWDYVMVTPANKAIQQGDRLLAAFWIKRVSAEKRGGLVYSRFEMNRDPWTSSIYEGITLPEEWSLILLPFEAAINHALGEAQLTFHLGIMQQEVEIGGVAMLNFGTTYTLDQLPSTQDDLYEGHEPEAAWRSQAQARIEEIRKGGIEVEVSDLNGRPVEGAQVRVRMKEHGFGFGTAVAVWAMQGTNSDLLTYQDKLRDLTGDGRTFSMSVLENAMKWGFWENPNQMGSKADVVQIVNLLQESGMRVRGHNLVWPAWQWLPDEIEGLAGNPQVLQDRILQRISDVAGYPGIRGELEDWDVLNEPAHLFDLAEVFEADPSFADAEEAYATWFNKAAEIDPDAKFYINEYSILSSNGLDFATQDRYKNIIEGIKNRGGRIDGIGMQAHMGQPLTPPIAVLEILDEFSALADEISITEYDASGVDEDAAGLYMRDFLTAVFSHPSVSSFLMWGFWDGAHWKDDAPLFDNNWRLKPSGEAFLDLVFNEWWTEEEGTTDAEGKVVFRGFYGTYEVEIQWEETTVIRELELPEGFNKSTLETALPVSVSTDSRDTGHLPTRLYQNYPNPSTGETRIQFDLAEPAHTKLAIYDMLGRERVVLLEAFKPAGKHEIAFSLEHLPEGVYSYRLVADQLTQTRQFIHLTP